MQNLLNFTHKAQKPKKHFFNQLAARGEFREAIRHLYLALLARLHREGLITYEPTQSNWEHLRAFRGGPEDRSPTGSAASRTPCASPRPSSDRR